ncbi:rhodanese-like protein [Pavlovales sp. CCMP2436]|nr:rhodanese-like protein [Pavlovales sp. CCMP2436]
MQPPNTVPVLLLQPTQPALLRSQQLVTAAWLNELTAGRLPGVGTWRLFEVDCGLPGVQGRIATAGYMDMYRLEQRPHWNKVADAALLQVLLEHGIGHDSCVILYSRNMLAAARAAHLMLYAGVSDVRLLDGGLTAWHAAGLPLTRSAPNRYPATLAFGAPFPARPEYMIDIAQARSYLRRTDATLVSIRSWTEYCGMTSGYSYIDAKGDIPGARWGRAGIDGDVDSMSAFQHSDGTMLPHQDIARFWREAGILPGQQIAFYCGTGWRASMAFFYAWLMGFPNISVYDGGWYEWSSLSPDYRPESSSLRCAR